jgi:hypothetical protein
MAAPPTATLIPLAFPLAGIIGVDPVLLVIVVAIASSVDFALVIRTPPTMLAYSTELSPCPGTYSTANLARSAASYPPFWKSFEEAGLRVGGMLVSQTAHIERSQPLETAGPRRSIMPVICGALSRQRVRESADEKQAPRLDLPEHQVRGCRNSTYRCPIGVVSWLVPRIPRPLELCRSCSRPSPTPL